MGNHLVPLYRIFKGIKKRHSFSPVFALPAMLLEKNLVEIEVCTTSHHGSYSRLPPSGTGPTRLSPVWTLLPELISSGSPYSWWEENHRITECSALEGTSVGHPVQPSAEAGAPTAGCTGPCPGELNYLSCLLEGETTDAL